MTKIRKGFGAFCYPPLTIYDDKRRHLNELGLAEVNKRKTRGNYFDENDFQVLITEDGFIAPVTENKKRAFEFLNVFFAILITKFHKARYITSDDLIPFSWEAGSNKITLNLNHSVSLRNQFEAKREHEETYSDWKLIPRQETHSLFILRMLDFAERFTKNEVMKTDLLLLGESSGLYFDRHFRASLLSSWVVIEGILVNLWDEHISKLDRTKKEAEALKNAHTWSVANFVEVFSFLKMIDDNARKCISKLRKIRNDTVHNITKNVTEREAFNSLSVAIDMVYNRLNQENIFEGIKYKEEHPNDSPRKE